MGKFGESKPPPTQKTANILQMMKEQTKPTMRRGKERTDWNRGSTT